MMKPWARESLILLGFALATAVLTWPLCAHFTTQIGGGYGDHYQTLWGMWWVRKALVDLHQSPYFSSWVHWPLGMPMVFETFDLPDCLIAIPLWGLLPPLAIFNVIEFYSYPLAGYFFYRFALELLEVEHIGADRPRFRRAAAVAGGALFTFAPYHFGHALGHMHIVAYEWIPLYFWMLVRALHRAERRWPILAALALAAVSTASWYHLLFCVVLTLPYLAYVGIFERSARAWPTVRNALLLGATYLAIMWPLFAAMIAAKNAEAWDGAHDPNIFSADLLEFFVPNDSQALGSSFRNFYMRWSGNTAENCDYLGYGALLLALLGAIRFRAARFWLLVCACGVLLAMGPHLHVNGVADMNVLMPYGWLLEKIPLLNFTGVPVRAGIVATFALSTAAVIGLVFLSRWNTGRAAAVGLLAVAAVEFWPHPFPTCSYPVPEIFKQWAADPSVFAVDDMSGDVRPLYNGVIHQHPMVDIYLSRTPMHCLDWLDRHPVLGRLRHPTNQPFSLSVEQGRQLLRDEKIRYFVMPYFRRDPTLERDLQLPIIYAGDGLLIYEVPQVG